MASARERYHQAVEDKYTLSPEEMILAERKGFRSWKNLGLGTAGIYRNTSRISRRY